MKKVLDYLRKDCVPPVTLPEFKEFWQACTEAERVAFIVEVEAINA